MGNAETQATLGQKIQHENKQNKYYNIEKKLERWATETQPKN